MHRAVQRVRGPWSELQNRTTYGTRGEKLQVAVLGGRFATYSAVFACDPITESIQAHFQFLTTASAQLTRTDLPVSRRNVPFPRTNRTNPFFARRTAVRTATP